MHSKTAHTNTSHYGRGEIKAFLNDDGREKLGLEIQNILSAKAWGQHW